MGESPFSILSSISHRNYFPLILNRLGLAGVGAEIGVQDGLFSEIILKSWEGQCLYSIDPWREFGKDGYQDIANVSQAEQDKHYEGTKARLSPFGKRSQIQRFTSHEASKQFEKEFFDFVYIDANHHYEAVAADIRLWYPKVKSGGILAGHDYLPDGYYPSMGLFGVKHAVDEFASKRELTVYVSNDLEQKEFDISPPSWFLVKK